MAKLGDVFFRANDRCRQRAHQRWHESQRKQQILRSQIGFADMVSSRPAACVGCADYHGHAYGLQKDHRVALICGIHPYGWQSALPCPDWREVGETLSSLKLMNPATTETERETTT